MVSNIKKYIKRLIYGHKTDSNTYISYLREKGMKIGERSVIYDPRSTCIDETRPWLICIGDDVKIAAGTTILTHGYDWSVLKKVYGEVLGSAGYVEIGNNVFVGMNTTILKGVKIGNNVIIGASSLVNKNIPDNCVVAGNPARVIMSLEDYYIKRKAVQYEEAKIMVEKYREIYGKEIPTSKLDEFFWLFTSSKNFDDESWKYSMNIGGNSDFSYNLIEKNEKQFKNLEDFLKSIK